MPESNYKYDNANKKNQNGGGAISHSENSRNNSDQATTTITNCVFSADPNGGEDALSCSTATNGGAIWTRAKTNVTITGCTIDGCVAGTSGGGVYLDTLVAKATLTGGSITDCEAVSGSAVYVGDSATFSGDLEISGNAVSGANSGAIQTVDAGKLYFEGNVKVEDNTSSAEADDHDVLMQIDGNTIINTTSVGLGSGAKIGVYVSDPNDAYANHGKYSQPFGTYHDSDAGSNFLDAFFNNRDGELYGYQGTDDLYIHWGFYVCKITDADGNTLKRTNGRDAVYQRLTMALDEFTSVKDENGETGKAKYIKMLVENYAIRQDTAISNFPVADITLTTETHTGENAVTGEYDGKHPYRGTAGSVCTIRRTNSENPLFNVNTSGATFQLKDITLDGRKSKTATEGDYKLITAGTGEIIVNSGTTLQYAKGDNGAAIDGVTVTINGSYDTEKKEPTVKITNCTATGSGGAISAQSLTINNASTDYGTAFTNCTSAGNGGAINVSGSTMSITGALFQNCQSTGEGGAVCHSSTGAAASSVIANSAFASCSATLGGGAVSSKAGTLTVNTSAFNNCASGQNGGAISHTGATGTTITDSTFGGCHTESTDTGYGFGGSVYSEAKAVTLNGGSFTNSTAANHGGALYCASDATDSAVTVSGTSFENCSTNRADGAGGAIYSKTKALTLQDYTPEGSTTKTPATINACMALGKSGAVHMETGGSTLTIKDSTVIKSCYAGMGGAIYLPATVTMNLSGSPEFSQNGYTTQNGQTVNASKGACIYLEEGGRINVKDSPKFSRNNITPYGTNAQNRVTNGGVTDYVRQDVYLAGYASSTAYDTNAASIYVVGELTGDTIWVWPEQAPHRLPNEQFAKIADDIDVSDDTLSHFRNSLSDNVTGCNHGEYLAGVQVGMDVKNIYWDKMYIIDFKKKDNKGVAVPGAEFTLYRDLACESPVATMISADGVNDTDAQGKLLQRGMVEFSSIRIGVYYMKESKVPLSFKENNATYLVLVGSPYLEHTTGISEALWKDGGPLDVADAATLVARYTTDAGKFYGIFPLDENNKAVLRANLASNNVGIENIRNDYQVAFMKADSSGAALPGAAFTIYAQMLDSEGKPATFADGYPQLMRWSRDGETYPDPVVSADGSANYKDKYNNTLPKGVVNFRELPLGTYYLLETAYPERNGDGRRTYYLESDRVFRLEVTEKANEPGTADVTLSEWKRDADGNVSYDPLPWDGNHYVVSNQEVVCKLTDARDNLLYTQGHQIWENKDEEENIRLFPAIYPTLEAGFADAQTGTFVDANGKEVSVSAIKLKVLKDFNLSEPIVYNSVRDITFTTAEHRIEDSKDRYIFSTTRTSDTSRALITRKYSADTSADANDGALITLDSGAEMTLQNIRLNGQKTSYNGRAIRVTGESTLTIGTSTRLEYFKHEAAANSAGGDLKGGAILMEDGTSLTINGGYSRTAIFANNEVNNKRTDGNTGSDGGAIAVGANCVFNIKNAQFTYNKASASAAEKGNGGAVSINKTKDAADQLDLPINNVVFSNNTASYKGGAIRTAENCNLTVSNCTFSANKASGNGSEGGAIAVLSKKDAPSTLTITNGTAFRSNSAGSGGAVKIGGYGTLELERVTMESNSATANGGAVIVAPGANVTVTNGSFTKNTATASGGAFYVEGKLDENGNPIRGTLSLSGSSIKGNTAELGGALYVQNNAEAIVENAVITENKTHGKDGGAINIGGTDTRLYFGGNPTVFNNFGTADAELQKNLVLSADSNEVINTTEDGLGNGGLIGVYVTDAGSGDRTVFEKHDLPGKPFGTFGDKSSRNNPQIFRSDHALSLYGVRKEDDLIYWVDVICKLTDSSDNILYQDITLKVDGKQSTHKAQAVYTRITKARVSAPDSTGFDPTLNGFDEAQGTLYSRNGTGYSVYPTTAQSIVKIKMLRDYELDKGIAHNGEERGAVFTTAEQYAQLTAAMKAKGDFFAYETERKDGSGKPETRALIKRGQEAASMITSGGKNLEVRDIVLDGEKKNITAKGGIVNVLEKGELTVASGAVLQNAITTGNGGAVYMAEGAKLEMTGGEITGNKATNGGAVYVNSGATMTLKNGTSGTGTPATTTSATINGNTATDSGAGIYLDEGSVLNLSGAPNFGGAGATETAIDSTVGNFTSTALDSDATNGQKTYTKYRQDIYVAGYLGKVGTDPKPATAIVVNGDITSGAGSIWVAMEKPATENENNHYEMLKQFAVVKAGVPVKEATMQAFRNAWDDGTTGCGADYLTGQEGDALSGWTCIYWTGGFDFLFKKIDSNGEALNGATFTLYKANAAGDGILTDDSISGDDKRVAYQVSGDDGKKVDVTAESREYTAANAVTVKYPNAVDATKADDVAMYGKGLAVFRKIPPGTYFMTEKVRDPETLAETTGAPKVDPKNTAEDAPRYQAVEDMYKVVLDGKGWVTLYVAGSKDAEGNPVWTTTKEAPSMLLEGKRVKPTPEATVKAKVYHLMNESPISRKLILRKVDKADYTALAGARFRVFRADMTEIVNSDHDETNHCYSTQSSGVYFIDKLPLGKYYLVETKAPTAEGYGDNLGKVFTLTVKDGMVNTLESDQKIDVSEADKVSDNLKTWVASQSGSPSGE